MLVEFFPRMHRRYSSLRLLGPILSGFAGWLHARGYPRVAVRRHLRAARRLEQRWCCRGRRSLSAIRRTDFQVCAPGHSQDDPDLAAAARVLKTYFEERGLLAGQPAREAPRELTGYQQYLTALRGLAPGTIADHLVTVSDFLQFIADKRPAISLSLTMTTPADELADPTASWGPRWGCSARRLARGVSHQVMAQGPCARSISETRGSPLRRKCLATTRT